MVSAVIYISLFIVKTAYAVVIEHHRQWRPNWDAVLIAIGWAFCVIAGLIDVTLTGPYSTLEGISRILFAFLIGGIPIFIWQVLKIIQSWFERLLIHLGGDIDGNSPD